MVAQGTNLAQNLKGRTKTSKEFCRKEFECSSIVKPLKKQKDHVVYTHYKYFTPKS